MADYTFSYGTTAAQIRTFLLNEYSNANYGAGNVLSFSILPTVPDQGIPQIGVYNFTITLEFDNIAGTFEVKDLTPPTLSIANRFLNFYTSDFPSGVSATIQTQEMLAQITVSDNLTPVGDILISFDRNRVNLTTPGTSQTYGVRAIDGAGNVSQWQYFTLTFIDDTTDTIPPSISATVTNFTFYRSSYANSVPANEIQYLIEQFTTATDNSGFVQKVISPTITQWSPSSWPAFRQYQVKAVDATGNQSSSITMSFEYIDDVLASQDTTPPTLTLTKVIYDYFVSQYPSGVTNTQIISDVQAFLTATDDSGTVFIDYIPTVQSITTVPAPGSSVSFNYTVRARDPSNNLSDPKTFTVNYINNTTPPPPVDTTPPQIIGPNSVTFLLSEQRDVNYLLTLYSLFDESGVVNWYQMVNFIWQPVGTYQFQLKAIDGSGNIGFKNITVNVVSTPPPPSDITPPTIIGPLTITLNENNTFTEQSFIEFYYTISDPSGISAQNLSPSVPFNTPGVYETALVAIDGAGNVARYPTSGFITITINPVEQTTPPDPQTPIIPQDNLLDKIFIGTEEITDNVKVGFSLIDKIDVELDSGTLIIPFTLREEPYEPFTKVYIYFKNLEEPIGYYVSDDSVSLVSTGLLRYQHQILLIEPTKILERFKCVDMNFVQPIDSTFVPYTLLDVVNRIYDNNPTRPISIAQGHWTSIDPIIENLLSSIKTPQLSFRSMTIREALDRAFQYINAIARLKLMPNGDLVLTADFLNNLDTLNQLENRINQSKTMSSEFYAENSELTVENATSEYATVKYPGGAFAGARSLDSIVNSDNLRFEVPFPIYDVTSLKIFVRIFFGEVNNTPKEEYREVDITPFVFEKSVYDALPNGDNTRQQNKEFHQGNTLYYTRGEKFIYNLTNVPKLNEIGFDTFRVIDLILQIIYPSVGVIPTTWEPIKFSDLLFKIEYKTLLTSRLRFMRDVKANTFGTIHTNQMENIVDLESLGGNARGIINRIGNPELTITKLARTWSDRFKVGQFTVDNYIVTTVENSFFNDHIKSTAQFTKNYNGLNRFVGVDTEIRQLPIPFATVTSQLHYDQFVMISDSTISISSPNNFAEEDFYVEFSEYLKQITTKDITEEFFVDTTLYSFGTTFTVPESIGVVEVAILREIPSDNANEALITITPEPLDEVGPFQPIYSQTTTFEDDFDYGAIAVQLEPNQRYVLKVQRDVFDISNVSLRIKLAIPIQFGKYAVQFKSYAGQSQTALANVMATPDISAVNNSIKIDFKFEDNRSAGRKIEQNGVGLNTLARRVEYTNSIGRFDRFSFKVAPLVDPTSDDDKILLANKLPSTNDQDYGSPLFESLLMRYRKDGGETFGLTYQMHFLPIDSLDNHVIVGKKFISRFFKGDDLDDISFKVYVSNETYTKFENDKVKGTQNTSENAYVVTPDFNNRRIKIEFLINLTNAKSFAIGTLNGDLVLGFNQINPYTGQYKDLTTIYLNFVDKRS